jgi:hypothetical protein
MQWLLGREYGLVKRLRIVLRIIGVKHGQTLLKSTSNSYLVTVVGGTSRLMQGSQTENCLSSAFFCVLPRNFLRLVDEDNKSSALGNYAYNSLCLFMMNQHNT